MSTTLNSILRVEITGVSTVSATHSVTAEAYDRITVPVPAASCGASTVKVDVQPGAGGQVRLVNVIGSSYPVDDSGNAQVTYSVDDGDAIPLDAPLLLVGGAIEELLGDVNQMSITNVSDREVEVTILVGRDAST